jgi:hypothetical protein
MAESTTPLKRQREEESTTPQSEETKRHKSYNHILSLLESEIEDEQNHDLSSIITALQRELSSDSDSILDSLSNSDLETNNGENFTASATSSSSFRLITESEEDEDDKERVMRHLLEASDDELGIPNRSEEVNVEGATRDDDEIDLSVTVNGGGDLCDGLLWELEDNYYTMFQSELFM